MSTPANTRPSTSGFLLATAATALAGVALAVQGSMNSTLGGVVGQGIFAATFSFLSGLIILTLITVCTPTARKGVHTAWTAVRTGDFPWWKALGGVAGSTIVIAQALTIPLIGVSVFTMALVAGQLTGALTVDNSRLSPSGPRPPTLWRVCGTIVVFIGVSLSAIEVIGQGIPLWAPLLPFASGLLNSVQQAINGQLRTRSGSAITASVMNFATGSAFLMLISLILFLTGSRVTAWPEISTDWWMLFGGVLGIVFIGVTTVTVARLGVLLLSLMSLLGNLIGSLFLDLTVQSAHAEVKTITFVSMGVVLLGVMITNLPNRPGKQGTRRRETIELDD